MTIDEFLSWIEYSLGASIEWNHGKTRRLLIMTIYRIIEYLDVYHLFALRDEMVGRGEGGEK